MKKVLFLILCLVLTTELQAQHSFLTYHELSPVLQTSPDAFKFGLYGYENPAVTSYLQSADMQFSYWNKDINGNRPWGLFFGEQGSGFGLIRSGDASHYVVDYRYSAAILHSDKIAVGINYGFVGGDKAYFNRSNTLGWGVLIRPNQYLSIGGMQTYALDRHEIENVADIAVRPFWR
jgi:protease-4